VTITIMIAMEHPDKNQNIFLINVNLSPHDCRFVPSSP
jgi:hypothetical protein